MDKISVDKSFDFYMNTLQYLDDKNINGSDQELKYDILEELESDAHTFLHEYTVNLLIDADRIPGGIAGDSESLRTLLNVLIKTKGSMTQIRLDNDWQTARDLAKSILAKIKSYQEQKAIQK